ncbi:MAG TPA: hypothetical protein PK205_08375 [Promineifilum sp.]|nr:hypothetical protein [Promineifilum sp.]HRQ13308.1 hypothetical protein [Promineifilum sp.]
MVRRLLTGFLVGGLAGAVGIAGVFLLMAALDGTLTKETIFYSLLAAVIGGFLGGLVGAIVGLGNMRWIGGALVGLVMAILVVVSYMTSFSGEGTFMQLLNRSRPIIVFTAAPLLLTGIITSWVIRRRN